MRQVSSVRVCSVEAQCIVAKELKVKRSGTALQPRVLCYAGGSWPRAVRWGSWGSGGRVRSFARLQRAAACGWCHHAVALVKINGQDLVH